MAFIGDDELYAWPGASRFEERDLHRFVSTGTVGSGTFVHHMRNVFADGGADFAYAGETNLEGARALRFDFRVPGERNWLLGDAKHAARTPHGGYVLGGSGAARPSS